MRRYLLLTVFVSGMTTLAAELAASRLIGNVFGTSNLVWAAIIGLILIYLSAGYFLGGIWADKSPNAVTLFRLLSWGAFTLGLVPYAALYVLRPAAAAFEGLEAGLLAGSFVAVLVLFSVPITLLGTITPFAIRLSVTNSESSGLVTGRIYAISTLGSFLGAFLPVLVTIPLLGTRLTFLFFSLLLLSVALVGLWWTAGFRSALRQIWMPITLIIIATLIGRQSIKNSSGQIFEAESAYNYIQVQMRDGYTLLRLNEGQGVHSIYHPDTLDYGGPWAQFLAGPYFYPSRSASDVHTMAIVGLAAGTTARQASAVFEDIQIDGYEIDREIVEIGAKYFGLAEANLSVQIGDGRLNLERSERAYDIIAVDAYRPPYIPPHMTTREFFLIAFQHLSDGGVLAINAASVPGDRQLVDGLATTIGSVFPSVYIADVPGSLNTLIYATRQPTIRQHLYDNLQALAARPETHPLLLHALATTAAGLQPGYTETQIFTDDRTPIESIVNRMVVSFVVGGGLQILE